MAQALARRYAAGVSRRTQWIITVGLVLVFGFVVPLGWLSASSRLRQAIAARCGEILAGRCEIAKLELARNGVAARRVRARTRIAQVSMEVENITIQFHWWPLLIGAEQPIAVHASGIAVQNATALGDIVSQIRCFRERGRSVRRRSRVTIDRVQIESLSIRARLSSRVEMQVQGARLEWQRTLGVEVQWPDAVINHESVPALRTGHCALHATQAAAQITLECDGPSVRLDTDTNALERAVADVRDVLRQLRTALRPDLTGPSVPSTFATQVVPTRLDSARTALFRETEGSSIDDGTADSTRTFTAVVRSGSVILTRKGRQIAEFRPVTARIEIDSGQLRMAHLRIGTEATGPAMETRWTVPSQRRWQLDLTADALPLRQLAHWLPTVPWYQVDRGRTRIHAHAEPAGDDDSEAILIDGELAIEDFGLAHAALAHEPIEGLSVGLRGAVRIDPVQRRIETDGIEVNVNGITMAAAGWVERSADRLAFDTRIRMPTTSCDAIRRALPANVTGALQDLQFSGTLAIDIHLALDTRHLPATQLEVDVNDQCNIAHDGLMQGIGRLSGPFVQRVQEPQGVRAFITGPGTPAWVPLSEISPYVINAVLFREDGTFYQHHGVDVHQVRAAIVRNVAAGRFVYGASTLSMQLAKNIFLAREKTLVRKLQELVFTWYLERSMDKDSILELYLNVVEFGPGIYGIGPASRFFFGCEPRELTPLQAIYLATVLPNPVARFANYQRGSVSADTLARLRMYARIMGQQGWLSPSEVALAQSETLVFRPPGTPIHGPLTQTVDPSTTDAMVQAMTTLTHRTTEIAEPTATPLVSSDEETQPAPTTPRPTVHTAPVRVHETP